MLEAPLVKMITVCDEKGYDVTSVEEEKGFVFWIWKEDKLIKKGVKVYENWKEGQIEVYNKLYKVLTK